MRPVLGQDQRCCPNWPPAAVFSRYDSPEHAACTRKQCGRTNRFCCAACGINVCLREPYPAPGGGRCLFLCGYRAILLYICGRGMAGSQCTCTLSDSSPVYMLSFVVLICTIYSFVYSILYYSPFGINMYTPFCIGFYSLLFLVHAGPYLSVQSSDVAHPGRPHRPHQYIHMPVAVGAFVASLRVHVVFARAKEMRKKVKSTL